MTTEQTEDEFTRKRRLAAVTDRMARAIVTVAKAVGDLRQDGLTSRTIVRQALEEFRPHYTKELEHLYDDSMIDSMSALLDLIQMMASDSSAGSLRTGAYGHLMGMMEGDPLFSGVVAKMETAIDRLTGTASRADQLPVRATIQRLFKENPSLLPDQAPAIECGVMLRGLPITLTGALSETPEGGLRLLTRGPVSLAGEPGGVPMIEQFFDYEDVMVVAVQRKVTVDVPRIIHSS